MAHQRPAIFLDRDGTINIDHNHVHLIEQFDFIPGVIEACKQLKEMGYALVIVTNQSGIGRGIFSEEQFNLLTEWMDWSFADRGVELDGIYYCPHHPEHALGEYKQDCDCRKPKPGMLLAAQKYLHLDMSRSYMVGDKWEDLEAGIAAKVGKTVFVKTGRPVNDDVAKRADYIIDSLANLPDLIKNHTKND